jgi:alpha-galactosidase
MVRRGEEMDLALVDIDANALGIAEGVAHKLIEARKAPIKLSAESERRRALPGATTVICTVGVGGRRAWERDVFIPRRHGIFQPVGDSVMPGGTSRALRMIPAMVEIAKDVLELAPNALFFNYGNPMAPVCRAIRKATGAPVVGLCHGVFDVGNWLADQLGVDRSRLRYTAVGMNHLTWFTEVRLDGQEAMPRLREIAQQKLARYLDEQGMPNEKAAEAEAKGTPLADLNLFSWQLTQLFSAFPAVLDRHVTEFFPGLFAKEGSYFGKTLGVDACSFERTIEWGDRIFEEMKAIALSKDPLPADYFERQSGEHEQVIEIIDSIRRDAGRVYSANLPNRGQVPNMPAEAVLESPAVADGGGVRAITLPPLPAGLVGTLATRLAWVETVVEAALEGSREKFVQALLLDGSVETIRHAERLADDLLAAQAEYLPQFAKA